MPDERAAAGRTGIALSVLALLLLILPVLYNPLIVPSSLAACQAIAAIALVLLVYRPGAGRSGFGPWILPLVPLGLASFLAASGRARAQDEVAIILVLVIAALLGRVLVVQGGTSRLIVALIALGCGVSLLAVLQHHVTYPGLAAWLRSVSPADASLALVRLEAGRPSGPLILPAALGGFLALGLPATLVRAFNSKGAARRVLLILAIILQVYALGLTRSLGGLAAAAVGVTLVIPALTLRHRRLMTATAVALVALSAILFVQTRRSEIFSAPGADPITLRAGNWSAAVRMISERPALGVGPGQFEVFYPRMMRPGMNETKYAHNSYLQAAASWGIWILVPLTGLIAALVQATRRARRSATSELPFLAGGFAFVAHNLIDFTAYLPAVAIPAAIVLGAGLARAGRDPRTAAAGTGRRIARLAATVGAVAIALLLGWYGLFAARSRTLLQEAGLAAQGGETERALDLARSAAVARPLDPDPHAFVAQLVLARGLGDEPLRSEGERASIRALHLQRESAILHHTRALYHRAAGESAPAYREARAAQDLNPNKAIYRPDARTAENGAGP